MKFSAHTKESPKEPIKQRGGPRQRREARRIMTATLLLAFSSRTALAAATASGAGQSGTRSLRQSLPAVSSSLSAFVPTRSVSAPALDRPSAFGLQPPHYRLTLAKQFSASDGSSGGEVSAGGAQEDQEEKRYPTLTRAALADPTLASNIHMYDLPLPRRDH